MAKLGRLEWHLGEGALVASRILKCSREQGVRGHWRKAAGCMYVRGCSTGSRSWPWEFMLIRANGRRRRQPPPQTTATTATLAIGPYTTGSRQNDDVVMMQEDNGASCETFGERNMAGKPAAAPSGEVGSRRERNRWLGTSHRLLAREPVRRPQQPRACQKHPYLRFIAEKLHSLHSLGSTAARRRCRDIGVAALFTADWNHPRRKRLGSRTGRSQRCEARAIWSQARGPPPQRTVVKRYAP